eukprot:1148937-Pelagomonas_calceolata.AAC.2
MASTAICEKKSASAPTIFEDIEVLAAAMMESRPNLSVLMAMCSSMNLHACVGMCPHALVCNNHDVLIGSEVLCWLMFEGSMIRPCGSNACDVSDEASVHVQSSASKTCIEGWDNCMLSLSINSCMEAEGSLKSKIEAQQQELPPCFPMCACLHHPESSSLAVHVRGASPIPPGSRSHVCIYLVPMHCCSHCLQLVPKRV